MMPESAASFVIIFQQRWRGPQRCSVTGLTQENGAIMNVVQCEWFYNNEPQ